MTEGLEWRVVPTITVYLYHPVSEGYVCMHNKKLGPPGGLAQNNRFLAALATCHDRICV